MPQTNSLLHTFRNGPAAIAGFAEDYSYLIQGLLDLYEAGFDISHLQWAEALQDTLNRIFAAPGGGYFSTTGDDPAILLRLREDYDGAEPSPNSIAALNLMRLAEMTGRTEYRDLAERTIGASTAQLARFPSAMPQMLVALQWSLQPPAQYVIAGEENSPSLAGFLLAIHREFRPRKILLKAGEPWLVERHRHLEGIGPVDQKPAVYRCENLSCSLPITDPNAL